ncbi:MAG TPA: M48 family metalloprotease [Vicinamibacterales bacterium]|jgi:predicted Zn-dependent protease|nr:M48 family metalloprotease [Vicinamibacterales bacterium]
MKTASAVLLLVLVAVPAHAQFGDVLKKAQEAKKKVDSAHINDQDERALGEQVSAKLVDKYGVVQDAALTKYVSLVGLSLAKSSSRPDLDWQFIVLDTDGVNAFAAPGGLIHITRGLLGLIKNESELAGALGHEVTHVTEKHTVHAIEKQKLTQEGTSSLSSGGGLTQAALGRLANYAYENVLNNSFSRADEGEADQKGERLASHLGYDPHGLPDVLKKLDARNSGNDERNGLFASHPDTKDRIAKLEQQITSEKLGGTAIVEARYKQHVPFDAKPVSQIATVAEGSAGLAGSGKPQPEAEKDQPKKKGGLLGKFNTSSSDQKQSNQTIASAGARGIGADRDARGGPNKTRVVVHVTQAELDAFKKGIA